MRKPLHWLSALAAAGLFLPAALAGCSTFKLQKGGELLYGHNLNQSGMHVPGMVFVNPRGTFKTGRSFSEMFTAGRSDPSGLCWISRYGSLTFSAFGRDFPDGGINEAGLYIWEMNDDTEYPKDAALPRLEQMNWMQYVLDNCGTLDDALAAARGIRIEGWGWHYFLGDARGDCAALEFIRGEVVVHRGADFPVPGLFNEPYAREVEVSRLFKGFGGLYEPDLDDRTVPRFVKTAVMIRDFDPGMDAAEYGLRMLRRLTVNEEPKWSVLIDAVRREVYFKTMARPQVKRFSYRDIDFSNAGPALALNMDQERGGDVGPLLHPLTDADVKGLLESLPLPDGFYRKFGLDKATFVERFVASPRDAARPEKQYFRGTWAGGPAGKEKEDPASGMALTLGAEGSRVSGTVRDARGKSFPLDHLHLVADRLGFTWRDEKGTIFIAEARLRDRSMELRLWGIEDFKGKYQLIRRD